MELISKADAVQVIWESVTRESATKKIDELPTVEERKEGEWVELQQNDDGTHNIQCSICRFCFKTKGHASSYNTKKHYVFCPHCGAEMKGE